MKAEPIEELVCRLRAAVPYQGKSAVAFLCHEAADTIAALLSELASLRSEREGMREGNSSVGSPAEAGTPSPSGGPVLRDGGGE